MKGESAPLLLRDVPLPLRAAPLFRASVGPLGPSWHASGTLRPLYSRGGQLYPNRSSGVIGVSTFLRCENGSVLCLDFLPAGHDQTILVEKHRRVLENCGKRRKLNGG